MTVTIAAKKNMTKISKEKQYWQQLAKEYEKKIELLKQAKASAQTNKKATPKTTNKALGDSLNNDVCQCKCVPHKFRAWVELMSHLLHL